MTDGVPEKRTVVNKHISVLPCVIAAVLSKYFAALRSEVEIDLLSVAHTSALASRVRKDQLD